MKKHEKKNLFEQLLEAGLADLDLCILSAGVRLAQADGRGVLRAVTDCVLAAVRVGPAANDGGGGTTSATMEGRARGPREGGG